MRTGKDSAKDIRTEIAERGRKSSDPKTKALVSEYHSLPEKDQEAIAEMIFRLKSIKNMGAITALETIWAIGRLWNEKDASSTSGKDVKAGGTV